MNVPSPLPHSNWLFIADTDEMNSNSIFSQLSQLLHLNMVTRVLNQLIRDHRLVIITFAHEVSPHHHRLYHESKEP